MLALCCVYTGPVNGADWGSASLTLVCVTGFHLSGPAPTTGQTTASDFYPLSVGAAHGNCSPRDKQTGKKRQKGQKWERAIRQLGKKKRNYRKRKWTIKGHRKRESNGDTREKRKHYNRNFESTIHFRRIPFILQLVQLQYERRTYLKTAEYFYMTFQSHMRAAQLSGARLY